MERKLWLPATATGALEEVGLPLPNWPYSFDPARQQAKIHRRSKDMQLFKSRLCAALVTGSEQACQVCMWFKCSDLEQPPATPPTHPSTTPCPKAQPRTNVEIQCRPLQMSVLLAPQPARWTCFPARYPAGQATHSLRPVRGDESGRPFCLGGKPLLQSCSWPEITCASQQPEVPSPPPPHFSTCELPE